MKKINIKDIAKEVGTSIATVSRALNNKEGVSDDMRKRVLLKAKELGYIANGLARGMKTSKTFTVGVLISDIKNPYFSEVISSMERVLYAKKYNLIICNVGENSTKEREYLELLVSKSVDGLLVAPVKEEKNLSIYRKLVRHGIKLVFFDRLVDSIQTDAVIVDNEAATYEAVRYLAKFGHKKIGAIYGIEKSYTGAERLKGFLEAIKDFELDARKEWIRSGEFKEDVSYERALEILSMKERPSAIIAMNNFTTLGVMRAVKELGIKVPDELSVMGFDDAEWMKVCSPSVTTIIQPTDVIGMTAATLLLDAIEGDETRKPQHVVLKATLLKRESVGEWKD